MCNICLDGNYKYVKGMPKRGAMVLIFVKKDGKSILQKVEALINKWIYIYIYIETIHYKLWILLI